MDPNRHAKLAQLNVANAARIAQNSIESGDDDVAALHTIRGLLNLAVKQMVLAEHGDNVSDTAMSDHLDALGIPQESP